MNQSNLMSKSNWTISYFKGVLLIETVKITTILIFESKKKVGYSKHRKYNVTKKCYVLICNVMLRYVRRRKEEKNISSNGFYRISQKKSGVSENSEIY